MTSHLQNTKQLLRNTLKEELRHVLYMILKVKKLNLKLLLAKRKRAIEGRLNKTKQVHHILLLATTIIYRVVAVLDRRHNFHLRP